MEEEIKQNTTLITEDMWDKMELDLQRIGVEQSEAEKLISQWKKQLEVK